MLPANMLGTVTSSCVPCLMRSPFRRSSGSAGRHPVVPVFRYDTSTDAVRLASPSMNHSKPRLMSVAGSTRNSPAVTAFALGACARAITPAVALAATRTAVSGRTCFMRRC